MFSIAEKCGQSGSLLMRAIQVKKYYFTGLIARLQFPFVKDITGLMDTALEEQLMAVKLQPNTGFLHNELGILYQIKKDFEQAKVHFERAIQLEPKWANPWTNLVVLYTKMGLKDEAEAASVKALGFQKNLFLTNLNIGVLQAENKNLLLAEEYFRKSIAVDDPNFLPFEKLAYAKLQTTQYALADSLFKEAKIRKPDILNPSAGDLLLATSQNIIQAMNDIPPVGSVNVASSFVLPLPGHEAPIILQKNDVLSNVVFGVRNFEDQKYEPALNYFKQAIAVDKRNPLAFHYIGIIYNRLNDYQQGEIYLKLAMQYFLEEKYFVQAMKGFVANISANQIPVDIKKEYSSAQYKRELDWSTLGELYFNWNHFNEAETIYLKWAETNDINACTALWHFYDNRHRYLDEEASIQKFGKINPEESEQRLKEFYATITYLFPDSSDWHMRAANFYYPMAVKYATEMGVKTKSEMIGQPSPYLLERCFEYYKKTMALVNETDPILAEINLKIANLYSLIGEEDSVYKYQKMTLQMDSLNASSRMALAELALGSYQLETAFNHLDTLNQRAELSFDKMNVLSDFYMCANQCDKADSLLNRMESISPYPLPELDAMKGKSKLLHHKLDEALVYYQNYVAKHTEDKETMYTIARIYAMNKQENEAFDWLNKSIKNGFAYSYVFKLDPVWNSFREKEMWSATVKK